MGYYAYINGPEWKARRARHLLTYGKRCEACHRTQDIEVHHRTYQRMGDELDTDLAVLCDDCHTLVHQIHKAMAFTTLDSATGVFIEQMRESTPKPRRRR